MRVGIMTMHRIVNHGSFMQAFGLKSMIESLGHEVCFVDYRPEACWPGLRSRSQRARDAAGRLKARFKYTSAGRAAMSAVGVYRPSELERKYAECLPMLGVDASGRNIGERVDTLIVGSDEVFNCFQAGPNVGFCRQLLGAGNHCGRLISYAASFGSVTCEQIRELGARDELRSLLSGFDALSVRDANSESVLDFLGLALHDRHLDPALVSGIEGFSWREPGVAGGYALVYGYGRRFTAEEGRTIRSVAERRGLRVISVYGDQLFCDENVVCRPDEILGYFKRADIVFTDTFHGTIFSAITHRPMVVICRPSNANKLGDLVLRMGLSDRVARCAEEVARIAESRISFAACDSVRFAERQRSLDYLSKNLKA